MDFMFIKVKARYSRAKLLSVEIGGIGHELLSIFDGNAVKNTKYSRPRLIVAMRHIPSFDSHTKAKKFAFSSPHNKNRPLNAGWFLKCGDGENRTHVQMIVSNISTKYS